MLLFLHCAPYLFSSYTATHLKTTEQPECAPFLSDSALKVYRNDSRRSESLIMTKISEHNAEINDFFKNHDSVFNKNDSVFLPLTLNPNGKFVLTISKKAVKWDSLSEVQLIDLFNSFGFDSIPFDPLCVQFNLSVRKKSEQKFSATLTDSINYSVFRSKASIMQVVMINLKHLRYAYNWRLRQVPGIKGKIVVKFAIDEHGTVIFSQTISSTVNDKKMEKDIAILIKRWIFCPIDKPGDVTEVTYPFVFSQ